MDIHLQKAGVLQWFACTMWVLQGTRQPIRNKQHTEMQEALKAIITSTPDYGYAVSNRPSNLCDKFGLIEGEALDEGQQLMYGDVLLIDKTGTRPDIVIDITVASTYSANHHSTQPGDMADKAEKTKRDKWRSLMTFWVNKFITRMV